MTVSQGVGKKCLFCIVYHMRRKQTLFCCCSLTKLCLTLCDPMDCSMPGPPVPHHFWSLPTFMSIESVMLSSHLILCHLLLLLPSVFATISVFSSELALGIRCPNYWSVNGISPSNEYSGLISFRVDWFDHPVVQETLKSLLQHHNLKASVLQCSAFFMVQFSYPFMTIGKTIALTLWTLFVLSDTLSRFGIAFRPRSKHLLET